MKKYEKPTITAEEFIIEDIVTTSNLIWTKKDEKGAVESGADDIFEMD